MATLYCPDCEGSGKSSCECCICGKCGGTGEVPEPTPGQRSDLTPEAILTLQEQFSDTNPKDLIGKAKIDLALIPGTALAHEAHAMMDGARKYGPYNWRAKKVGATVYVSAALRHILDWYNRQDVADDSKAHHLGHARACLAILLDAIETGNLVDDRPPPAPMAELLDRLNKTVVGEVK